MTETDQRRGRTQPFKLLPSDAALMQGLSQIACDALRLADAGTGYAAIATTLQVPIGTVKSRLNRARLKIIGLRKASACGEETGGEETGGAGGPAG